MKKYQNVFAVFVLLLILTGCSSETKPSNEVDKPDNPVPEQTQTNIINNEEHITKQLSDNFLIDADIPKIASNEYAIYSVKNKEFHESDLDLFLSKEDTHRTFTTNPNRPNTLIVDTGNGSSLSMGDGTVDYRKNDVRDSEIVSMIEDYLIRNGENVDSKDFSNQKKQDAVTLGANKIKEVLDCQVEALKVVSMSHEQLEQLQKGLLADEIYQAELENGTSKEVHGFSDADDVYYIQYAIKLDDLFLYNEITEPRISMNIDAFWYSEVNVTLLINGDGIRYFRFNNVFDGFDHIKERKPILSAAEALKLVEEKYNNIIVTDQTTISKIWLEYVPVPTSWETPSQIELRPYWCFQLDISVDDGVAYNSERINAVTGGNLANGA